MRAVLDANVLFPTVLREILIDCAKQGLFVPLWSRRILDEWRHAAARLGHDQDQIAGAEIALIVDAFPGAMTAHDGVQAMDLDLPDPADRHVIESALAGRADHVVTANLRDFPRYLMQRLGLRALHPDAFLLDLSQNDPSAVVLAVEHAHVRAQQMGGEISVQQMLKRSRLPRVAKLMKG